MIWRTLFFWPVILFFWLVAFSCGVARPALKVSFGRGHAGQRIRRSAKKSQGFICHGLLQFVFYDTFWPWDVLSSAHQGLSPMSQTCLFHRAAGNPHSTCCVAAVRGKRSASSTAPRDWKEVPCPWVSGTLIRLASLRCGQACMSGDAVRCRVPVG